EDAVFFAKVMIDAGIKLIRCILEGRIGGVIVKEAAVGRARIKIQQIDRPGVDAVGGYYVSREGLADKAQLGTSRIASTRDGDAGHNISHAAGNSTRGGWIEDLA